MLNATLKEENGRVYVEVHPADEAALAVMVAHGKTALLTREETKQSSVMVPMRTNGLFPVPGPQG